MANLVSPGVSVTVTNESFFIPASATTVPLFFLATADQKKQADGITPAAGTYEYNVIRTVTSLTQSTQLFGVPTFLTDINSAPQHGDCRNEYGTFALNQYLGIGSLAYTIRANVNLNDNLAALQALWDSAMTDAATVLESQANAYINQYNTSNGFTPTSANDIDTFSTLVGGSGYVDGIYLNVPLTGGTGSGATANITVSTIPATHGKATIAFTASPVVTPATLLGILGAVYTFEVAIDGGVSTVHNVTATGTDTMTSMAALMQATLTGATVAAVGNAFVITSSSIGALSTIVATIPASTGTDLVGAINTSLTATNTNTPVGGVDAFSAVTVVTKVLGGTGFTVSDVLTASNTHLGGSGSGFTIMVATLIANPYKQTLDATEVLNMITSATLPVFAMFSFRNSSADFFADWTATPLSVFSNGFSSPAVPPGYFGVAGAIAAWVIGALGSIPPGTGWTPTEASSFLLNLADGYKYTTNFLSQTSLGANDAARRTAIITALAAIINSNTDIRSETYEYNLIVCPGFPELAQEMVNLSVDIQEEALVIADTPFDKNADDVVTWSATVERQHSTDVTYYYPHGLATNLDGAVVFVAASGTALRTIAYSDNISNVWFAPAGTTRGAVTSLTDVGYVSGTLGTATTFVPVALNQGQRDNLYKYFTNINPIVFFPGRGIIVWGQKTSPSAASALDRINVARLIMYIKRSLRKNTMPFVFEPNDKLTQDNLKAMVDAFLGNLITKRGLYDYATVCDSSNNTPARIDANELYIDIALKPVRAAEFIYIPIRIVATSASLTSNG